MTKVVPCPGVLSTVIAPPCSVMMPCTTARPKPVPSPTSLVVKNGSKMRSRTSGAMPCPVSRTVKRMYGPGLRFRMGECALGGKDHSVQADFQHPPGLAHGMRGIRAEVHEYLLHLGGVGQHSTGREVYLLAESNRGWEHGAQQLQHFLDEEVQLERLALLLCLAAKREHLLHQVPGALPSHEDLLQVIPGHALPRHICST